MWCSRDSERSWQQVKKTLIAGGIAAAAVFAGVLYFARDPAPPSATAGKPTPAGSSSEPAKSTTPSAPVSRTTGASRPAVSDPRLAALMVSPDNERVEFFADAQGRVIREIDNDPSSVGYRKPMREYTYAGDRVIRLVAYRHLGNQVQIVEANVVYKPDGSIDKYQESTRYEPENKR
jgi:hypothetical protein